jgi:hypothetical protein
MKITETYVNAKTGETRIVERELTEQEIAEMEARQNQFELNNELNELVAWFEGYYRRQVEQYNRCQRTGDIYDKDIVALDKQANDAQIRIREIKNILKID